MAPLPLGREYLHILLGIVKYISKCVTLKTTWMVEQLLLNSLYSYLQTCSDKHFILTKREK